MKRGKASPRRPFFHQLFDANPQPVLAYDLKTFKVVFANKAAVEFYGYSREEFLTLKADQLQPAEKLAPFREAMKELEQGGKRVWRARHLARDGRLLDVEVVHSLIKWKGRPAVLTVVEDGGGAPRDERARQRDLLFQLAVQHVEEFAIFMLDREGRVISWNSGAERLEGYREEEIVGRPFAVFFEAEQADAGLPGRLLALAKREGMAKEETPLQRKDGSRLWASLVLTPVKGPAQEAAGFVAIMRDIGERKRAQEESRKRLEAERRARSEAEASSRSKDEFLAVVSHELRTPMTAILGWVWLLKAGGLAEPDRGRAIEAIERNMRLQSQIIEQLLDISSIVTGKIYLVKRPVDAAASLRESLAGIEALASQKDVRFEAKTEEAMVRADPHRLQQIFWHLLANAVKFSRQGGRVKTSLSRSGDWVVFRVEDEGQGIAPEFLPRLFDPLIQEEDSLTRQHSGLGIGLAIVKNLVRLHEGTVAAESPGRDRGATFTVRLPLSTREASALLDPVPMPAHLRFPKSLERLRILLVDDEPDSLRVLSELLMHCGAEVATAASAAEALTSLTSSAAHLLISDLAMPGQDGFSLIRRVRALGPERGGRIPALALTALARAEDRERALREGYQGYLVKPVEPAQLVAALRHLAGRSVDTRSK